MRRLMLLVIGVMAVMSASVVEGASVADVGSSEARAKRDGLIAFVRWGAVSGVDARGGLLRTPEGQRIYVMNADGSGQRRLTPAATKDADYPAWSPDGRKVAFSRDGAFTSADGTAYAQIYVMNGDGSGQRKLTRPDDGSQFSPAWSPDGRKIAFVGHRLSDGFQEEIYVVNADGSGQRRLTRTGENSSPAWSPDGRKIAFAREPTRAGVDSGYSHIYVMNADGSGQRRLTTGEDFDPAWSPDGHKIAFSRYTAHNRAYTQIFVVNADGSGLRRLTHTTAADAHPTWSPDGRKIAYTQSRDIYSDIYVMNADGSGQRNLTRTEAYPEYHPAWSPAPR